MHGPIPARMRSARAPSATMPETVASITPASVPRQPPCAAPITPAAGSANNTGAQSAARMPRAIPGAAVTMPSARGAAPAGHGSVTVTTAALWTWLQVISRAAGRPSRSAAAARLRATLSGSSPEPKPQLSEANSPSLTPPRRVKKACRAPPPSSAASLSMPSRCSPTRRRSSLGREPRRRRQTRRDQRHRLEQGAHLARIDQAAEAAFERVALFRRRRPEQGLEAQLGAERNEEFALHHGAVDDRAGGPRRRGEGGEIDVGAEVGGARRLEHAGRAVPPHRRQAGAEAAREIAVIDDQRRALVADQPLAERGGQRRRGRRDLDDGAGLGRAQRLRHQ